MGFAAALSLIVSAQEVNQATATWLTAVFSLTRLKIRTRIVA